jgi:oligo-1,6-glucosidase
VPEGDQPAVARGDFRMLLAEDEQVYAFTRRLSSTDATTELLVLGNFSASTVALAHTEFSTWVDAQLTLGNYREPMSAPADTSDALPALQPWETRVYRRSTPFTDA